MLAHFEGENVVVDEKGGLFMARKHLANPCGQIHLSHHAPGPCQASRTRAFLPLRAGCQCDGSPSTQWTVSELVAPAKSRRVVPEEQQAVAALPCMAVEFETKIMAARKAGVPCVCRCWVRGWWLVTFGCASASYMWSARGHAYIAEYSPVHCF